MSIHREVLMVSFIFVKRPNDCCQFSVCVKPKKNRFLIERKYKEKIKYRISDEIQST